MREITVKSATALTSVQKAKLEGALSQGDEVFYYIVSDDVIGGLSITDGSRVLDYTAERKSTIIKARAEELAKRALKDGIKVTEIPELIKKKLAELAKEALEGEATRRGIPVEKGKDYVPVDGKLKWEHISHIGGTPLMEECGRVVSVQDGVVHIEGLNKASYGELITIARTGYALVMKLAENEVGAIILDGADSVEYGDIAFSTGKIIEVPVGEELLGRVVDPLGNILDGGMPLLFTNFGKIEDAAPRIIDRGKVNEPLSTGILAIDSMIPIGKGQRELIIGDRQTGKTAIAIDTIINQKGKGTVCVYVAIGQRMGAVASLVKTLSDNGALAYTVIVLAAASDNAPLQYIAPYSGTAIAEYFMKNGKDVLIVYDDLTKHAAAYRTVSLLLKRPSGREAFPGDIFYIHSRLLERAAKLSQKLGGGSLTALPIIETQAGDISAYIPTNVISITDGQIYLENELFKSGQRPAVNVGLSVSRVGGSAQTKIMRKLSSTMRLDIAHYRELQIFAQFGSTLDHNTKETLEYGAKICEAIKQNEYEPLSLPEEGLYLFAIVNRYLKYTPINRVKAFLKDYYSYVLANARPLYDRIRDTGDLTAADSDELRKLTETFVEGYE
ncbi:MAG: F0F1 ATP synthase subunit alpha [Christensenellaceae bacterium]|jgi:F-type H+-transporting ATPase subunit alpha|nr:F0F1 ATP synthase subunit alpha [Christensenellaceae bacterium]